MCTEDQRQGLIGMVIGPIFNGCVKPHTDKAQGYRTQLPRFRVNLAWVA